MSDKQRMSVEETSPLPGRLTVNDPVPPETLKAFEQVEDAKTRVARELLTLEQRKVQLLAAAKKIDDQFDRLFESILVERGIAPNANVDIDVRTGQMKLNTPKPDPIPQT